MAIPRAAIQDERITGLLQRAVNTELTVSQHYWGRAVYWRNLGMKKLVAYYEKEATEERGHAQLVADRSAFLGIVPEMNPEPFQPTATVLSRQFSEDLAGEIAVADQYAEWVQEALDLKDFVTMDVLKRILKETEDHVDYLQQELSIAQAMGDQLFFARWAD